MADTLLNALFDEKERRPLSVSELTARVKSELELRFAWVWVEGEIVNFTAANSGHWYFNLNDGFSQIRAVCFRTSNYRIGFKPDNGLSVRVRGRLTVYEKRGEYQLVAESIEPAGKGALRAAFEQIRTRLDKEGLFDPQRKRPLPFFPRRVGVVTSPTGAAIHDIVNVLTRRTRSVHVVLIPARVQGEFAGEEIAGAIELANNFSAGAREENKIDVLIVGRGGGAAEDLWAFNEERVARAVYGSKIPVISAVGHETDLTIADMVADLRAPTPSAAAEMVAAHEAGLMDFIAEKERNLSKAISWQMLAAKNEMQKLSLSHAFTRFPQKLKDWRQAAEIAGREISSLVENKLSDSSERVRLAMAALDALSPLSVLGRGYSITYRETGEVLRSAEDVYLEEKIKIRLARGSLEARVTEIED